MIWFGLALIMQCICFLRKNWGIKEDEGTIHPIGYTDTMVNVYDDEVVKCYDYFFWESVILLLQMRHDLFYKVNEVSEHLLEEATKPLGMRMLFKPRKKELRMLLWRKRMVHEWY
jgi:hypothetical protein